MTDITNRFEAQLAIGVDVLGNALEQAARSVPDQLVVVDQQDAHARHSDPQNQAAVDAAPLG